MRGIMGCMTVSSPTDEVIPASAGRPEIIIRRSARRRRTLSARMEGSSVLVMVPAGMRRSTERRHVMQLVDRMTRKDALRRRTADAEDLERRARRLARTYLEPRVGRQVRPESVRWVTNQSTRWGSCTPSTGRIRLSDRMIGFPEWVVDFVLAHELCHLVEADHNQRFHELLAGFPHAERAEGFLRGYQWAIGAGDVLPGDAGIIPGDDGAVAAGSDVLADDQPSVLPG